MTSNNSSKHCNSICSQTKKLMYAELFCLWELWCGVVCVFVVGRVGVSECVCVCKDLHKSEPTLLELWNEGHWKTWRRRYEEVLFEGRGLFCSLLMDFLTSFFWLKNGLNVLNRPFLAMFYHRRTHWHWLWFSKSPAV